MGYEEQSRHILNAHDLLNEFIKELRHEIELELNGGEGVYYNVSQRIEEFKLVITEIRRVMEKHNEPEYFKEKNKDIDDLLGLK